MLGLKLSPVQFTSKIQARLAVHIHPGPLGYIGHYVSTHTRIYTHYRLHPVMTIINMIIANCGFTCKWLSSQTALRTSHILYLSTPPWAGWFMEWVRPSSTDQRLT